MALGLPIEPRSVRPGGLAFAFKQDLPGQQPVMIGHDEGLITINIAEADSPFREKTRKEMGETYRTLLGHFRHEIGHYYWDRLVADSRFRSRFAGFSATSAPRTKRRRDALPRRSAARTGRPGS